MTLPRGLLRATGNGAVKPDANHLLFMDFESDFTDATGNFTPVVLGSGVSIDTVSPLVGVGSMLVAGNGQLSLPLPPDLAASDFTFEFKLKPTAFTPTTNQRYFTTRANFTGSTAFSLILLGSGSSTQLRVGMTEEGNTSFRVLTDVTFPITAGGDIAFQRVGDAFQIWVNSAKVFEDLTFPANWHFPFFAGADWILGGDNGLLTTPGNGRYDTFRISNIARLS